MRAGSRCACLALAASLGAGCRVQRPPEALLRGDRLEAAGRTAEALEAYREAAAQCTEDRADCRLARLQVAETLDRLGRLREAERTYLELLTWTGELSTAARAADRAADLLERRGQREKALALSRQIMERFPDEVAAEDSLRRTLRLLSSTRQQGALAQLLLRLYRELHLTGLGDNLLYEAARLYERNARQREAIALFDQLADGYAQSPLRDDSLWRAGQLLEAMQDWEGALHRYRRLLRTRRDAFLIGSYNSVRLPDAQLRVGLIYLDRLGNLDAAVAAFEELRDSFSDSTLRDDAQWWIAQTHLRAGRRQLACHDLRRLEVQFPDGNQLRKARLARAELGCPQ